MLLGKVDQTTVLGSVGVDNRLHRLDPTCLRAKAVAIDFCIAEVVCH